MMRQIQHIAMLTPMNIAIKTSATETTTKR
jgi:hypothetical protein